MTADADRLLPTGVPADPADDGSAPPALAAALAGRVAGTHVVRDVVAALAEVRVLVPLLEVSGDVLEGSDTDPCAGTDRAVAAVSLRTEEGAVGLAFSSLAALAAWNGSARPWPTPAPRVAAAVLADGGVRLLVDPGSEHGLELAGPALHRLAAGEPWPEPYQDPVVRAAVAAELGPVLRSGEVAVRLAPPAPDRPRTGLTVEVVFPAGVAPAIAEQRARIVADRLAANVALGQVFDGTLQVTARIEAPA